MKTNDYPILTNDHVARMNMFTSHKKTTGNAATESGEQSYMKTTNTAEEHCRFQTANTSPICQQPILWTYSGLN